MREQGTLYTVRSRKGLSDAGFEHNVKEVSEHAVWTSGKGISGRGTSNCKGCEQALSEEEEGDGCGCSREFVCEVPSGEKSYTWMRRPSYSLSLT